MFFSVNPNSDVTLYEKTKATNTGMDAILELEKRIDTSVLIYNSRILVKFDLSTISSSIVDGTITGSQYFLNLYTSEAKEIPSSYTIYAYPVSQSWAMGLGKKSDNPATTDGVSWQYRSGSIEWATGSYQNETTGSWTTVAGGATWYTGSGYEASQSFDVETTDIRVDVTDIVNKWLNSTISNEGFIIKRTDANEQSNVEQGIIQFFSSDTHTVYPPKLEVGWDDSSFATGSLSALTAEDIIFYTKRLQSEYNNSARIKFRVSGRERYPTKTYATSSQYLITKYLPQTTYYSVKDAHTDETAIPFSDDYTKVSCDSTGNYFNLWMDGLQPERYYRFVFKIVRSGGIIEYFDNNFTFKVVR